MLLEIENKVIILDEAHNMEDSARDAASLSVTNLQLTDVSKEINKIKEQREYASLLIQANFSGKWRIAINQQPRV